MLNIYESKKEPDILEVISDLSNDEVFTPPAVAKRMLDLLPPEIWSNPALRWIDPFTKTGVFVREITKRLLVGLKAVIPDDKQRLEHILRNMVFGVAITELTSLMSRRSLYCSKWADSEKSAVKFSSSQGNLLYARVEHEFFRGRCSECLAGESQHGAEGHAENYAYALLHQQGRRWMEKEIGLKFDVVVGNPPYQMDGGGGGTNATPLYNLFVDQAKALDPDHIVMIIPSRWMAGGRGLDQFRSEMLSDNRIEQIVDYPNASDLFPGVEIKGGVCYFHWNKSHQSNCNVTLIRGQESIGPVERKLDEYDIFVRDTRSLPILHKVLSSQLPSIMDLVSGDTPFGLASNFKDYRIEPNTHPDELEFHGIANGRRFVGVVSRELVKKNTNLIGSWKLLVPEAYGAGETVPHQVLGQTIVTAPGSCCSQSYLVVGPFNSEAEAKSAQSYLSTKFARFLIQMRKISQHALRSTYLWVPQVPFDRTWNDELLFNMFAITEEEQSHIASLVKEM